MQQKIYPDPHGVATWEEENFGRVDVHIVNSMLYREITGEEAPLTPITGKMYTGRGLPWYALYDEERGDFAPSDTLGKVKSVGELDRERGFGAQQDVRPSPPYRADPQVSGSVRQGAGRRLVAPRSRQRPRQARSWWWMSRSSSPSPSSRFMAMGRRASARTG